MANEQMSAQEQALAMIAELRKLYMGYAVEFFGNAKAPEKKKSKFKQAIDKLQEKAGAKPVK